MRTFARPNLSRFGYRPSATVAPSGALASSAAVPAGTYSISILRDARAVTPARRYTTNNASFAANLATAFQQLGITARLVGDALLVETPAGETPIQGDPRFSNAWMARVEVQSPTSQALLHRALARAAWHASTWTERELLPPFRLVTGAKAASDGGASLVNETTFSIDEAGGGRAITQTPANVEGTPAPQYSAQQRAAQELDALAARTALYAADGRMIASPDVRRLQTAMGMTGGDVDGLYGDGTRGRMRYLGVASPSPSFRQGQAAPPPRPANPAPPVAPSAPAQAGMSRAAVGGIVAAVGLLGVGLVYSDELFGSGGSSRARRK